MAKTGGPFVPFMEVPPGTRLAASTYDATTIYFATKTAIWKHAK